MLASRGDTPWQRDSLSIVSRVVPRGWPSVRSYCDEDESGVEWKGMSEKGVRAAVLGSEQAAQVLLHSWSGIQRRRFSNGSTFWEGGLEASRCSRPQVDNHDKVATNGETTEVTDALPTSHFPRARRGNLTLTSNLIVRGRRVAASSSRLHSGWEPRELVPSLRFPLSTSTRLLLAEPSSTRRANTFEECMAFKGCMANKIFETQCEYARRFDLVHARIDPSVDAAVPPSKTGPAGFAGEPCHWGHTATQGGLSTDAMARGFLCSSVHLSTKFLGVKEVLCTQEYKVRQKFAATNTIITTTAKYRHCPIPAQPACQAAGLEDPEK
ncbi:hypothetical protein G7046_g8147 [Stylonectria norvegica]|nr:hypothetical protein G7046_g8147 [Stylonectria norvegica]